MVPKAEPKRMCTACREMKNKRQLLRIVRSPEGELKLDLQGKSSGRGAYLCRSTACLQRAKKTHSLEKSLKCQIPETVWAALTEEIRAFEENEHE